MYSNLCIIFFKEIIYFIKLSRWFKERTYAKCLTSKDKETLRRAKLKSLILDQLEKEMEETKAQREDK